MNVMLAAAMSVAMVMIMVMVVVMGVAIIAIVSMRPARFAPAYTAQSNTSYLAFRSRRQNCKRLKSLPAVG